MWEYESYPVIPTFSTSSKIIKLNPTGAFHLFEGWELPTGPHGDTISQRGVEVTEPADTSFYFQNSILNSRLEQITPLSMQNSWTTAQVGENHARNHKRATKSEQNTQEIQLGHPHCIQLRHAAQHAYSNQLPHPTYHAHRTDRARRIDHACKTYHTGEEDHVGKTDHARGSALARSSALAYQGYALISSRASNISRQI
ncbi:hypothetical protein F511_32658 [Dorcoceras hygrometricum]|uniref:Uncharacterized protein n=1 Tax=Dorcoceras hygrometricum TaxID=472368 RepID=A0A2Z7BZB0_9LAMI|nr:hypothetical protein F511_32658 [Dorcoceras hygrometricum]